MALAPGGGGWYGSCHLTKDPVKAFKPEGGHSVNVTVQMHSFQRSNDIGCEILERGHWARRGLQPQTSER